MQEELHSNFESSPKPFDGVCEHWESVHQFRFLPESFLAAVGTEWDPGLGQLVYLRMFIEEETEAAFA